MIFYGLNLVRHYLTIMLATTLLTFSVIAGAAVQQTVAPDYQLGAGDHITITVYGEEDLDLDAKLGDSGVINYPYLGIIKVSGLTTAEVEKKIEDGLRGDYLVNPSVHVGIEDYRPFYIFGEVKTPGSYPYEPGLTIDRAVALAGGLTERASMKGITVTRRIKGKDVKLPVKLNSQVRAGDTVFVDDTFF